MFALAPLQTRANPYLAPLWFIGSDDKPIINTMDFLSVITDGAFGPDSYRDCRVVRLNVGG